MTKVEYRTLSDLHYSVRKLIDKLPSDIDLVVGIPRCGMIPATLIAMDLNLPLSDINTFCAKKLYSHVINNKRWSFNKVKKVLVVDDSIASGRNMSKVKDLIQSQKSLSKLTIVYSAVYATVSTKDMVDCFAEIVPHPRVWEWDITLNLYVSAGCIDIDGILCRDPTREEKLNDELLSEFYSTVKPLIKPPFVDTIVTGRREIFRRETETWLNLHDIKYNKLIMRQDKDDNASFKAKTYHNLPNKLFIESSLREAQIISKSGKQVITPFVRTPNLSLTQKDSDISHIYKPSLPKGSKKLNILFHAMGMRLPGGASISCCEIMAELYRRGYNCKITASNQVRGLWTPSKINHMLSNESVESLYKWADIVLVHWFVVKEAIEISKRIPSHLIYYVCDVNSPQRLGLKEKETDLLIFNSYWLMNDTKWHGNQIVVHPIVYPELFETNPGSGILMVTPDKSKGIDLFLKLCEMLPNRQFVIGKGRTRQNFVNTRRLPPNVTFLPHVPDVRQLYSHARILLMPSREDAYQSSKYGSGIWVEGYGRVAMEAACSGIPTIGSRESKGLRECLGPEGLFAGQNDADEWVKLINKLDDKEFYKEKSEYYYKLVRERNPEQYIDKLEEKLLAICRAT